MHCVCSVSDARLLNFDKVTYDGALFQLGVHSQMSEWSNGAIIGNLGIKDHTMVFDSDAIAKARIGNTRTLMNLAGFTDDGLAFDVHVGMNHAVASDLRLIANVGVGWIDEGYAFIKHQMSDCAAPQKVLEFGQFSARVDAQDFTRVVMTIDRNVLFLSAQYLRDVGQVIFALTIRRLHLLERREKFLGFETINSSVNLANLSLLVVSVS